MANETKEEKKPLLMDMLYELKSIKKGESLDLNKKSQIFLIINDSETSIPLDKLFLKKIIFDDEDIRGYSVLQMITDNTKLKIDSDTTLNIIFIDKTSGKQFYIHKIRRPIFPGYDKDIEITAEERLKYIDLLLSTTIASISEPSVNTVMTPEQTAEAEKAAAAALAAEEEAKRIKAEEEKAIEDKRIADEAAAEAARNVIGGVDWEAEEKELLDQGLVQYKTENYRFFYKGSEDDGLPEIAFFILVPGDFYSIELYEEDVTNEIETYSFEDMNDAEWNVTFNKKDGTLLVEEAKVNS